MSYVDIYAVHKNGDTTYTDGGVMIDDETYSKEERDEAIRKMTAVSNAFYRGAAQTGVHTFIEFCGLLNEFIKICRAASERGVDFMSTNTHTGKALPIETYQAKYVGEKVDCIYGPSFKDPEIFRAFVASLKLPFEVEIKHVQEDDHRSS